MNILFIANSYGQDSTRYLHDIARADGVSLNVVNLYYGGCSLEQHYNFFMSGEKKYLYEFNGIGTGLYVSLSDVIGTLEWDYVVFQQLSGKSVDYNTYMPYLKVLSDYVKEKAPNAKQIIHQTWAWHQEPALKERLGYNDQSEMFRDLVKAYDKAAKEIGACFIVPSGTLFQELLKEGFTNLHRDTVHASKGIGRYALALLWFKKLTGHDITDNSFSYFDEEVSKEQIKTVKECINRVVFSEE